MCQSPVMDDNIEFILSSLLLNSVVSTITDVIFIGFRLTGHTSTNQIDQVGYWLHVEGGFALRVSTIIPRVGHVRNVTRAPKPSTTVESLVPETTMTQILTE